MDTSNVNNVQTKIEPKPLTFTLHLPGFKKTVQYSYPNTNSLILNNVCTTFGIVQRRAELFKLDKNIAWALHYPDLSDGDTLILVVRGTTVEGENEYYENQKDSLMNNKYLEPSISKHQATKLLAEIDTNFSLFGHRNWLPGGTGYNHREYYKKLLVNYPEENES